MYLGTKAGTCKGCGADILWAITEKGERMPLDPEPVVEGCVILRTADARSEPRAHTETKAEREERLGADLFPRDDRLAFVPHWSTCPQAGRFKRKAR